MGYFNIDFNQFKPSKSLKTATASAQPKPVSSPVPQPTVKPQLVNQPLQNTAPQPEPTQDYNIIKKGSNSFLSKLGDVLTFPSRTVEKFLTKSQGYEKAYSDESTPFMKINRFGITNPITNPLNLIPSYKKQNEERFNESLKNETAKKIGAAASGLVLDPLNVIPFGKIGSLVGKVGSKIPGIAKVAEVAGNVGSKVSQFAKETPFVYKAIEAVNPYFRNPEFGKAVEATTEATRGRLAGLYDSVVNLAKGLSPEDQAQVGRVVEGIEKAANPKIEQIARTVQDMGSKIGQEAVDMGLLSPESYNKFKGQYLSHIFLQAADEGKNFFSRTSEIPRIAGGFFKQRKGAEGFVKEFAPATFKGLGTEIKDIELARFLKGTAEKYGKPITDVIERGFSKVPSSIEGSRAGKFFKGLQVPQEVADYLERTIKVSPPGLADKIMNVWKQAVTIWNPAYHSRNLVSNQILANMSTGGSLVKTVGDYVKAARSYFGKGNQEVVDAAKSIGLIKTENFGAAMDELLEMAGLAKKSGFQVVADFPKKLQQVSEETAKLNVFQNWIQKTANSAGKSIQEILQDPEALRLAADKAQEAIFSPYRISATERSTMSKIVPFYSFTRQALPFFGKTLAKNPERIAKFPKAKEAIERFSPEGETPSGRLPDNYEGQIRLPIKNEKGQYTYFDPSYIYPWGNFLTAGGEKGQLPFGFSFNPFIQEAVGQAQNKDIYTQQPITESTNPLRQIKDRAGHVVNSFSPSFVKNVINKVIPAVTGKPDRFGRERGVGQSLLDTFFGLRTTNASPEELQTRVNQGDVSQLRSFQDREKKIYQTVKDPVERAKQLQELQDEYQQFLQKVR